VLRDVMEWLCVARCDGVAVALVAAIVFLYQKYKPEDGQITGRNMLVKIL